MSTATKINRIKDLPPGIYDLQALRDKLELKCSAIIKTLMVKNGAFLERIPCGPRNQHVKIVFYWDGIKS